MIARTPGAVRAAAGLVALAVAAALLVVRPAPEPGPPATEPPPTDVRVASAGAARQTDDDAPEEATGSGLVQLASQTTWLRSGEELTLRLRIDGAALPAAVPAPAPAPDPAGAPDPAAAAATGPRVEVRIHDRVRSRSAFQRTLVAPPTGAVLHAASAPLAALDRDPSGAVVVRLPTAEGTPGSVRGLATAGVYPVVVSVIDDGDPLESFTTHVVRVPDGAVTPLAFSWIVPFHAQPAQQPGTAVELGDADRRRLADLVARLEAVPRVPLTLAPTPETLDALARSEAPEAGVMLAGLRDLAASDPTMVLPFVRVDAADLVRTGDGDEIVHQRARGSETVQDLIGVREPPRTWLVDSALTPDALRALSDLGVDQLIVDEAALEPITTTLTLTQPFVVRDALERELVGVVADADLADRTAGTPTTLDAHHLLAELAVLFFDQPAVSRGVVLRSQDRADLQLGFLESVLAGLAASPIVRPASIDEIAALPPAQRDRDVLERRLRTPDAPDPAGGPRFAELRSAIESFALMVGGLTDVARDIDRLALVAASADLAPATRSALRSAAGAALRTELAKVGVPERRTITLTSRVGEIPVTVRNSASYPVEVVLRLDSDRLLFPAGATRQVVLPPGNTTAAFPVESRSSGAFPLAVSVSSPDGRLSLGDTRYTIRSTTVSGVGILLSVGGLVVLLGWWALHLRRERANKTSTA